MSLHAPDRHISKQTIWITTAFTCAFLVMLITGTQSRWMPMLKKPVNPKCTDELVTQLSDLGLKSDRQGLRNWMKKAGPKKTADCVGAIDGRFDRFGQARMEILSTIVSLKNEGLSMTERQEWAEALSDMAQGILRPGKTRSEYMRQAEKLGKNPGTDSERTPANELEE